VPKKRRVTKGNPSGLTAAQSQASVLIAGGMTVTKTADAVGVTRKTLWEWMQLPAFDDECKRHRDEIIKAAKEHIQGNLLRAAERVSDALDAMKPLYLKDGDGFAPVEDVPDHQARLRGAFDILDRAGIPRKVEAISDDPYKALVAALVAANEEHKASSAG